MNGVPAYEITYKVGIKTLEDFMELDINVDYFEKFIKDFVHYYLRSQQEPFSHQEQSSNLLLEISRKAYIYHDPTKSLGNLNREFNEKLDSMGLKNLLTKIENELLKERRLIFTTLN